MLSSLVGFLPNLISQRFMDPHSPLPRRVNSRQADQWHWLAGRSVVNRIGSDVVLTQCTFPVLSIGLQSRCLIVHQTPSLYRNQCINTKCLSLSHYNNTTEKQCIAGVWWRQSVREKVCVTSECVWAVIYCQQQGHKEQEHISQIFISSHSHPTSSLEIENSDVSGSELLFCPSQMWYPPLWVRKERGLVHWPQWAAATAPGKPGKHFWRTVPASARPNRLRSTESRS